MSRETYFCPFSCSDEDAEMFTETVTNLSYVLWKHSPRSYTELLEALYRLSGYLCNDMIHEAGGVAHEASTVSAADTD